MNIEYKKLDDIKPYENNPRDNEDAVDYVADSIKQFGFKVPIVIDKDGTIVTGHTRYKASQKLGLTEVPCIVADDLTEAQVRAFRLADNKTSEYAWWDYDKLEEEIDWLSDFGLDMSEFGFEKIPNMIDYLDEVGFRDTKTDAPTFEFYLSIPAEHEQTVRTYVKKNGKEGLTQMIIRKCEEGLKDVD